jgi:hypothetical protein
MQRLATIGQALYLRLFFHFANLYDGAPSTLKRNKAFKRRRRKPRLVFCSREPFWDGS